ncbi:MAG: O-antigen ligase family protein [Proteobacteria bacterium]|nr:O-antigen ligase family protein [Pseudomonadota bacterium]
MRDAISHIGESPLQAITWLLVVGLSVWLLTTPYYFLAPLPGLAIPLMLFFGRRPAWGFLIIIFLVPFSGYTGVSDAYRFLTISKFIGIFMVGLSFLLLIVDGQHRLVLIRSNLWPWLLGFFAVNLVSASMSVNPDESYDFLRRTITDFSIVFLALFFVSDRIFTSTLPKVVIASTAISAALSIFGFVFNIGLFAMNVNSESVKRAVGATHDPNYFSAMLIFSLPLLVHFFIRAEKRSHKVLLGGVFLLNMSATILTYSRGGALILALVLVILLAGQRKWVRPRHLGLIAALAVMAALAGLFVVPSSYWARQKTVTDAESDRSIGRRVSYLVVAWSAFKKHPLLGSGPETFKDLYQQTTYARMFQKAGLTNRRAAHNAYVEVLVGTGLMGLAVFLAAIGRMWINFGRAVKRFKDRGLDELASLAGAYRISFLTMLLSFLVLSANNHKYFWLCAGLSALSVRFAGESEAER